MGTYEFTETMMDFRRQVCVGICLLLCLAPNADAQLAENAHGYQAWENGVPTDPNFFPIAIWVQSPRNASRYREAGINVYVGLWKGPTAEQLSDLKAAGMKVVCAQNALALESPDNDIIVAWMHGDEPDNAQARTDGKGYGPPILPSKIVEDYQRLRTRDATRPVLLNLGQGVAYDNYIGRGVRRNHPEDYREYLQGCDIASFDIYPAVHDKEEVAGKLEFVAKGVERLRRWSDDQKIVWNCIEASRISNVEVKPTPSQIRAEVWMSLIHGSHGLIYFVHQFEPRFREASLLDDPELLAAVTKLNTQIHQLAPVLNSPTIDDVLNVSFPSAARVATMCKRQGDDLYVFAVNMQNQPTSATFSLAKPYAGDSGSTVARIGEVDHQLDLQDGRFADEFDGYGVRLYRITLR